MSVLSRLLRPRGRRALDAAGGGWRWAGHPVLGTTIPAPSSLVRHRAAYQARNDAHVVRAVHALVSNIVGTGLWPRSRHPDEAIRTRLAEAFAAWSERADAAGRLDWPALQTLLVRSMIESGEAFVRRVTGPDGRLRLQVLHPDQVDPSLSRDLDNGHRIRAGIELDPWGAPVAYHVLPQRPGDLAPLTWEPVRVPADSMIHLFEVLEPGQVRGLSWLAPVMLRLHELAQYEDAQLVRQKVAALFVGFLKDPQGDGAGFTGAQTGGLLETGLEPGTLKVLPPGYDVAFSTPAEIGENDTFIRGQLRAIAAGLGVTYEQLTGDLSGVNYSSIRAGLIEFRRRVDSLRWTLLVPRLCRPVWRWWLEDEVLAGTVPLAAYGQNPAPWLAADWHAPGWDWVDPVKDTQAEIMAVEAGFKARSQVIAERGEDPVRVDTLRRQDAERGSGLEAAPRPAAPAPGPSEEAPDA
ncbi:phage portal protein [Pararhodospirillum oryzae]|uniref:Phage portal protein n=1 Tax=Pararhodospirillum oryzae TaxID=478448 RepID=A0A512H917_9PROT|nr:phage portal protein [Pararhodospirillum oryzae]GEO81949.1 phage portal protein [Pararhodospirillum oryzae]